MTKADAIAAIKTTTQGALTASDINGLEGCTDEQLTYILQGWKNIAKVKGKNVAQQISTIMAQVPEWAQLAVQIGKVLVTVFG